MKPEIPSVTPINDSDDAVWETMFFHTDIVYDFKSNYWIWNSTNEHIRDFEWDNNNEFDAFYPYMQDAVCVLIKPDFVRHQIFVSISLKKHLASESQNKKFNIGAPYACGLDPRESVSTNQS